MSLPAEQPDFRTRRGAPRWLMTFADLMCLMLCLLVLMLSSTKLDFHHVGALEKAFNVRGETRSMQLPKPLDIITRSLDEEIVRNLPLGEIGNQIGALLSSQTDEIRHQVDLQTHGEGITIRLMGESIFDSGRDEIREQLKPLLKHMAVVLEQNPGDIIIGGHTDDLPVSSGPFKSNLRLSIARAAAVADFLLAHSKIEPHRISTVGSGEHRPIYSNQTESGREKNRRVEVILNKMAPLPPDAN
jgi:chemotaxis protein MotB